MLSCSVKGSRVTTHIPLKISLQWMQGLFHWCCDPVIENSFSSISVMPVKLFRSIASCLIVSMRCLTFLKLALSYLFSSVVERIKIMTPLVANLFGVSVRTILEFDFTANVTWDFIFSVYSLTSKITRYSRLQHDQLLHLMISSSSGHIFVDTVGPVASLPYTVSTNRSTHHAVCHQESIFYVSLSYSYVILWEFGPSTA